MMTHPIHDPRTKLEAANKAAPDKWSDYAGYDYGEYAHNPTVDTKPGGAGPETGPVKLKEGWIECWSEEYRMKFYHHPGTNHTQWPFPDFEYEGRYYAPGWAISWSVLHQCHYFTNTKTKQ